MSFESTYQEAMKVSKLLGSWVVYAARDGEDAAHLIGYMLYTVEDFARLRRRSESETRRKRYVQLIGDWRRAVRWVQGLHPDTRSELAGSIIQRMGNDPVHSRYPLCAPNSGHRSLSGKDTPQRRAGRPRIHEAVPARAKPCGACKGLGLVPG